MNRIWLHLPFSGLLELLASLEVYFSPLGKDFFELPRCLQYDLVVRSTLLLIIKLYTMFRSQYELKTRPNAEILLF